MAAMVASNQQPKVNLVHPNRAAPTPSNAPTPYRQQQTDLISNGQVAITNRLITVIVQDKAPIPHELTDNVMQTDVLQSGDNTENTKQ